jgi:nitrogen regulatory protein P-II 1
MDVRIIVAIIRRDRLEQVEKKLQDIGVEDISVSKVKGYGEYHDFFARNWMVEEVRVEIFTRKDEVETIATTIMEAAHTGLPGDGVVAVIPVEKLFLIRTRSEATPEEFGTQGAS